MTAPARPPDCARRFDAVQLAAQTDVHDHELRVRLAISIASVPSLAMPLTR
jgi:hypothetical protein